jgi:membrane protease YdiL (CAAX protease family)
MRRLNFNPNHLFMFKASGPHGGVTFSAAFLILMGLLLTGFVLGGGVAIALWPLLTGQPGSSLQTGLTDPSFVNPIRILQLVSTFFIFFLPALATARILDRRPLSWLGYNRLADVRVMMMALLLMALSIPVVGLLSDLNEMIPVPSNLEAVFQSMEEAYERQVKVMTRMNGWGDYIFSLLVMALGPAIFEETFFRGGLQRILHGMTGRTWSPVIITALVFSAIHFSYFGFIPRVALGIVLGLLYQFSGSLWTSIAAHFLNNAVVVTMIFIYTQRGLPPEQAMEADAPVWIGVPAVAAVVFIFIKYKSVAERSRKERMDPEDKAWEEKWLA